MIVSDGAATVGGWSRKLDEFGRDLGIIVKFLTGPESLRR
jgi:hypothetical protein